MTRRRLRRVAHEEVGLQIAPMIDVTLLLLFFFMLSGKLTRSAKLMQINVPTAAASHDTPATSSPRDVINIDADTKEMLDSIGFKDMSGLVVSGNGR
jgi:biopolymer transport protein ExbD